MGQEGAYARSSDPSTSHEAADRVNVSASEQRVYDCLLRNYPRSMTSVEISTEIKVDKWTVSPRLKPLENKGLIECTGKKPSVNSNGRIRNLLAYKAIKKESQLSFL